MTETDCEKSIINTTPDCDVSDITTIHYRVAKLGKKIIHLYIENMLSIADIALKLFKTSSGHVRQTISDYLTKRGIPIERPMKMVKRL